MCDRLNNVEEEETYEELECRYGPSPSRANLPMSQIPPQVPPPNHQTQLSSEGYYDPAEFDSVVNRVRTRFGLKLDHFEFLKFVIIFLSKVKVQWF